MIFLDTETCGFYGPAVLIQYQVDDGPIELHNIWYSPISETLDLIERFMYHEEGICGFNLAFDHYHLCKIYNMLYQLTDEIDTRPIDIIEKIALAEEDAWKGPCLKPVTACDIMLHARRGPYQSTMDRGDIKIKKIPTALAYELAEELNRRVKLPDIYFARKADPTRRWTVADCNDDLGEDIPEFKNIYLRFQPSSALKALAVDALGMEDPAKFYDVMPKMRANELGYAPFCTAIGSPSDWDGAWPVCIEEHADHWQYNAIARSYASDDVKYTKMLWSFFGSPEGGDRDSILACMVATVRLRGFKLDLDNIKSMRTTKQAQLANLKFNYNAPHKCRLYLNEVMTETEQLVIKASTKSVILEEVSKWKIAETCECNGLEPECAKCMGTGLIDTEDMHPAAVRAAAILEARHAIKEIELYNKLLTAKRFYASFKVIGTLSSRMAGADGLNAQGIKRSEKVRACFPLADGGLELCAGDFAGFEVCIMDAVYADPVLHADLTSGKKIHALFGQYLFPTLTYEEIVESKGASNPWQDYYTRSKNGVFALAYGGEAYTLSNRVGIREEEANEAYRKFVQKYKKFGEERKRYFDMFCSMRQPGGIGSKVEWNEPSDCIESLTGFKRYFTLENKICKVLFGLAEDPPKVWKQLPIKVVRRDRQQTACGALRSALFAASFALQAANMRAAGNHVIQCTGAELCKELQVRLWGIQPTGITYWYIQPMNVHDEILAPMLPSCIERSDKIRELFIEEKKSIVPLLEIEWSNNINSWAEK